METRERHLNTAILAVRRRLGLQPEDFEEPGVLLRAIAEASQSSADDARRKLKEVLEESGSPIGVDRLLMGLAGDVGDDKPRRTKSRDEGEGGGGQSDAG